jgi:hypothetical protein
MKKIQYLNLKDFRDYLNLKEIEEYNNDINRDLFFKKIYYSVMLAMLLLFASLYMVVR